MARGTESTIRQALSQKALLHLSLLSVLRLDWFLCREFELGTELLKLKLSELVDSLFTGSLQVSSTSLAGGCSGNCLPSVVLWSCAGAANLKVHSGTFAAASCCSQDCSGAVSLKVHSGTFAAAYCCSQDCSGAVNLKVHSGTFAA